jgi:hypothetical protein
MSDINFETGSHIRVRGTKKVGEITTTYNHLVDTFGKPLPMDQNEGNVEWRIEFEVPAEEDPNETDLIVATIYDWKTGINPVKRPGDKITFTIGGHNIQAAYYVHLVLGE